jgi:hypothetical protein
MGRLVDFGQSRQSGGGLNMSVSPPVPGPDCQGVHGQRRISRAARSIVVTKGSQAY